MTVFIALLIFLFGTALGSFLSVLIYRIHAKKSGIIFSKSICPECKKKLKWRHLVPIFSWIFLRGKCAYCGKRISIHYFILELATGLLFMAAFLKWNFLISSASLVDPEVFSYSIDWNIFEIFIFYVIEFTFLVGIFFYDLKYKIIPDRLSVPAIGVGIAGALIFGFPTVFSMFIGATAFFVFFLLQFLISKGTWIGGGDLRMGILIGVLLGWKLGIASLIIAYVVGAIISVGLLIKGKANRKTALPFGPFLIIGILTCIFYGQELIDWYFNLLNF